MTFSRAHYKETISQISMDQFDLVIIGGGVTGAGILLDAQSRGLKAVLFEKQDFAGGTSSRSTKLIHGGLRYLKQKNIALVAEVGKERQIVAENAPHLIWKKRVFIPFYKGGSLGKFTAKAAMLLYEKLIRVEQKDKHQLLKKDEVLREFQVINSLDLKGGVAYTEYATDDSRLTIEILKKAVELGGVALNYTSVKGFEYDQSGVISGVHIQAADDHVLVKSKGVISAAGPWADDVLGLDREKMPQKLILTKGVHLVISKSKLDLPCAAYFDTDDQRMIFAIPKDDIVYIGTTDTFFESAEYEPGITQEDVDYLINAVNQVFSKSKITASDVISGWSGLRPLIREAGKSPSEISRKDEIFTTDSGLITIAGGKLTGYRMMAEKVITKYLSQFSELRLCKTGDIKLSGGETGDWDSFFNKQLVVAHQAGIEESQAKILIQRFGSNMDKVLALYQKENYDGDLPVSIWVSIIYGLDYEMVTTLSDFFIRRTGMFYFEIELARKHYKEAGQFMATKADWSPARLDENYNEFEEALKSATFYVSD